MFKKISVFIILTISILCNLRVYSQSEFEEDYVFRTRSFDSTLKTLQIFPQYEPLSLPYIFLDSDKCIEINFDDVSSEPASYSYSIIHCDRFWKASDLFSANYIEGYAEDVFKDYKKSFNTYSDYVHYKIVFPNENTKPIISGNYAVLIYQEREVKKIAAIACFSVVEDKILIEAEVKRPSAIEFSDSHQAVYFKIKQYSHLTKNPTDEFFPVIIQNFNFENRIVGMKPEQINSNELIYNKSSSIFEAGKEYRYFDTKSIRFLSINVKKIFYDGEYQNFILQTDEPTVFGTYFFHEDLNGSYLVKNDDVTDSETEANYVKVVFTLNQNQMRNGKIYFEGNCSNNILSSEYEMKYLPESKQYNLTLILKQGYYNYRFLYKQDNSKYATCGEIEGSFYQTENLYTIFVYFHSPFFRYDRLIGFTQINSIKKM